MAGWLAGWLAGCLPATGVGYAIYNTCLQLLLLLLLLLLLVGGLKAGPAPCFYSRAVPAVTGAAGSGQRAAAKKDVKDLPLLPSFSCCALLFSSPSKCRRTQSLLPTEQRHDAEVSFPCRPPSCRV